MKSTLLTTTALIAFAGAAVADGHAAADGISFGGTASLEYNDITNFTSEANIGVTLSRALDNGLTAKATVSIDIEDTDGATALSAADYVLSLSSDTASLSFGAVDPVAAAAWSGVDGSQFGDFDADSAADAVLAGSATFGDTTASISYDVDYASGDLDGLQLGVTSTIGGVSVAMAYQDDSTDGLDGDGEAENQAGELLGVSVSTTVANADVKVALLTDMDENSFGIDVAYPLGPVTVGGYYTVNSAQDDEWAVRANYDMGNGITAGVTYEFNENYTLTAGYAMDAVAVSAEYAYDAAADDGAFSVDASYDLGNGLNVLAGVSDNGDSQYAAVNYDLGNGAKAFVRYASEADNDPDEEFAEGTTVGMSFTF